MSFTRNTFETWFVLQRQLIGNPQRACLRLQGTGLVDGTLALGHPADATCEDSELTLAARLAEQSRTPVISGGEQPGQGAPLRIAYPLDLGGRISGTVVVEVEAPLSQQSSLIQLLQWGETWLRFLLESCDSDSIDSDPAQLAGAWSAGGDYPAALTAVLAMLSQQTGCTRVACGLVEKGKTSLAGVSLMPGLNPRSRDAVLIKEALREIAQGTQPATWPGDPDTSGALAALARESGAGSIVGIPPDGMGATGFVYCFEFSDRPGDMRARVEHCRALALLASPLLELRRRQGRPWLASLAALVREGLEQLLSPLHRWRHLGYASGLLLLAFVLLADTGYRVTARAVVEAASQQTLVAPFESYVAEAPVRAGEQVESGTLLLRLDDRELKTQHRRLLAEAAELRKKHRRATVTGELSEAKVLEARFEQARARLMLVEDRQRHTEIRSPLDGMVISGDWQRSIGAPVARGDTLFEIAPLNSYRIILLVEDRDIAQIRPSLEGELILAALPSRPLPLHVGNIVTIADPEELTPVFRVEAGPGGDISALRPGMEGIAKVEVGQRPRWWIWTHELVEWLRLRLWQWLP